MGKSVYIKRIGIFATTRSRRVMGDAEVARLSRHRRGFRRWRRFGIRALERHQRRLARLAQ